MTGSEGLTGLLLIVAADPLFPLLEGTDGGGAVGDAEGGALMILTWKEKGLIMNVELFMSNDYIDIVNLTI